MAWVDSTADDPVPFALYGEDQVRAAQVAALRVVESFDGPFLDVMIPCLLREAELAVDYAEELEMATWRVLWFSDLPAAEDGSLTPEEGVEL